MFTAAFWKATTERMIRTFAASALTTLAGDQVSLLDLNWVEILSVGGGSAVVTLLIALAASRIGPDGPGLTETTDRSAITRV